MIQISIIKINYMIESWNSGNIEFKIQKNLNQRNEKKEFEWYSRVFSEIDKISEKNLDIFLVILEKIDGYIGEYANDVLKRLKSYIPIFKDKILEFLKKISKSKHQDWLYIHTAQLINEILNIIITEGYDKDNENRIIQIVDLLIKKGYLDFKKYHNLFSDKIEKKNEFVLKNL